MVDPRTALVGSAVPVAAGRDKLAVDVVAVAVDADAEAVAADGRDGLRRTHEDLLAARRRDGVDQLLVAGRVELAVGDGVVVVVVDDAHRDVIVYCI